MTELSGDGREEKGEERQGERAERRGGEGRVWIRRERDGRQEWGWRDGERWKRWR